VPGLGDIPLLGNAFKGRDDSVRRTEVIFLITPHIVKDKGLSAAAKVAVDGIEMTRVGQHDVILPWSRSKMSAGHVRDALRQLEANNTDKALWETDKALGLDPSANEARRLREKLTGERAYVPGRSLLDDAVDQMVKEQTGQRKDRGTRKVPNPEPVLPQSSAGAPQEKIAQVTPEAPVESAPATPAKATEPAESTPVVPAVDALKIVPAVDTTAPVAATAPAAENDKPATEPKQEPATQEPATKPESNTNGAEAEKKDQPAVTNPVDASAKPVEEPKAQETPKAEDKPKTEEKPTDAQTESILKDFGSGK
jgi:hypothetical protein